MYLDFSHRLAVTYKDLRSVPEFVDKTILAVKAPQDTILNCDVQEVSCNVYPWLALHPLIQWGRNVHVLFNPPTFILFMSSFPTTYM